MVGRSFTIDVQDPSLWSLFAFKANVFEISGIPKRVEVALDGSRIVNVSGVGEDSGPDGFGGDTAIATDVNSSDYVLLADCRGTEQEKNQDEAQQRTLAARGNA